MCGTRGVTASAPGLVLHGAAYCVACRDVDSSPYASPIRCVRCVAIEAFRKHLITEIARVAMVVGLMQPLSTPLEPDALFNYVQTCIKRIMPGICKQ